MVNSRIDYRSRSQVICSTIPGRFASLRNVARSRAAIKPWHVVLIVALAQMA